MTEPAQASGFRRVLLPMSRSAGVAALAEFAARAAGALGLGVEGLFIEEEDLLEVSNMPFTHDVSPLGIRLPPLDRRRIERELRGEAMRARQLLHDCARRRRIAATFEVRRGAAETVLSTSLQRLELIAAGPGFGCIARRWSSAGVSDFSPGFRVAMRFGDDPSAPAGLPIAARLAVALGRPMEVMVSRDDTAAAAKLRTELSALKMAFPELAVEIREVGPEEWGPKESRPSEWRQGGRGARDRLYILPVTRRHGEGAALFRLLCDLDRPALLVATEAG